MGGAYKKREARRRLSDSAGLSRCWELRPRCFFPGGISFCSARLPTIRTFPKRDDLVILIILIASTTS